MPVLLGEGSNLCLTHRDLDRLSVFRAIHGSVHHDQGSLLAKKKSDLHFGIGPVKFIVGSFRSLAPTVSLLRGQFHISFQTPAESCPQKLSVLATALEFFCCVSVWCVFRTVRSVTCSQMDDRTCRACSAFTSFVKYAERRVPVIARFLFFWKVQLPFLQLLHGGRWARPEKLFPVLLLTSGMGKGCRRCCGLGVPCRSHSFSLTSVLVVVLECACYDS